MMNCFVISCLLIYALGADEELTPSARLESRAEVVSAEISHDGKSLIGIVKNGKQHDLTAWDIRSKSKTVLATGADITEFSLAPAGSSSRQWRQEELTPRVFSRRPMGKACSATPAPSLR